MSRRYLVALITGAIVVLASSLASAQTFSIKTDLATLRAAAGVGKPSAMFYLGSVYSSGRGVTKDVVEAYKWLDLSARFASPNERARSVQACESLARVKTPAMILEAKQREAAWQTAFIRTAGRS